MKWAEGAPLTHSVRPGELPHLNGIHVAVITQFELHQVHLHFAVLHEHTLLYHMPRKRRLQKGSKRADKWEYHISWV